MSVRRLLAIGVSVLALLVGVAVVILNTKGAVVAGEETEAPSPTDEQLLAAADARVYFGHQSVGQNVVDGLADLYGGRGLDAPTIVDSDRALSGSDGVFQHSYIGENGDPIGKIRAFDTIVRGGVGGTADVVLMKLCYVDITRSTDVEAVFAEYRETIAALHRDYPDLAVVHVTTPLTREPDIKAKVKAIVGRPDDTAPLDNAARESYNALLRAEYAGSEPIFDIAAAESTGPDGRRLSGEVDGQPYFALYDEYSSDPGHLNAEGAVVAAEALMAAIDQTVRR